MESIEELLKTHPSIKTLASGKLKCSLTGHEMVATLAAVQSYTSGTKYQKSRTWYSQDFSKYEPYIKASRNSDKRLFCVLTREELNKIPEEVEAYVNTPRYIRAVAASQAKAARAAARAAAHAAGEFVHPSSDEESGEDGEDEDDGDEEDGERMNVGMDDRDGEGLEEEMDEIVEASAGGKRKENGRTVYRKGNSIAGAEGGAMLGKRGREVANDGSASTDRPGYVSHAGATFKPKKSKKAEE